MKQFHDLSLLAKLTSVFGLLAVMMLLIGAVSINGMRQTNTVVSDINQNWMPSITRLLQAKADVNELRTYQYGVAERLRTSEGETLTQALTDYDVRMDKMESGIRTATGDYQALISTPEEQALWAESSAAMDNYLALNRQLREAAGRLETPVVVGLLDDLRDARRATAKGLQASIDYNLARSGEAVAHQKKVYRNSLIAVVVGTLIATLCGLAIGAWLARSLSRRVAAVVDMARGVSAGELARIDDEGHRDELGTLQRAMGDVVACLSTVVDEQQRLGTAHREGRTDHRIDADRLPGVYAEMARNTNALIQSQLDDQRSLTEVVSRYAIGDFSADMPQLPGLKAQLTETAASIKTSLMAMQAEMGKLAQAASQGDFSVRGDESRFQHQFKDMVASLNRLMANCDDGIAEVSRVIAAIAEGRLDVRARDGLAGRLGELCHDTNRTADALHDIVGEIHRAALTIRTAASEIAAGNSDLSTRTERQAASLEETASSMEELTGTVRSTAENARQAAGLAGTATTVAERGGTVVQDVVTTMSEIQASSNRIADIISVIDGIAFQTNILALNAAVEAARAGEQGRGFAVVASEVRSLSQRTAQAAQEIKTLIGDSVGKVGAGSERVQEAGSTMQDIVQSVRQVSGLIGDISNSSQEQSSGIDQVNDTVTQLDEMTQQNAALVEQSTATARALEDQVQGLVRAVSHFKVGDTGAAADNRPTRPAPAANKAPKATLAAAPAAPAAKPAPAPAAKPQPKRPATPRPVVVPASTNEVWESF